MSADSLTVILDGNSGLVCTQPYHLTLYRGLAECYAYCLTERAHRKTVKAYGAFTFIFMNDQV